MQFVILCRDKPGGLDLRLANRATHLDYLNGLGEALLAAGPFLGGDDKPLGSMLIVDVASEEEAKALAAGDPYATAGLFEHTEIRRWRWGVKPPQGL